jgi:hypothetical protein
LSPRRSDNIPLSLRVVQEWEKRVCEQKALISHLKMKRQSVKGAEADLKLYQGFLDRLRTHREIVQELMAPDPLEQARAIKRDSAKELLERFLAKS